jgi:hypothetical protein
MDPDRETARGFLDRLIHASMVFPSEIHADDEMYR